MNSTCLKHYEMLFVIVRSCIRKITLIRVSALVTGNPKMLVINVYASYVSLLPLEVQSNLSISEAMFGIPTPPIRLRLRRFRT